MASMKVTQLSSHRRRPSIPATQIKRHKTDKSENKFLKGFYNAKIFYPFAGSQNTSCNFFLSLSFGYFQVHVICNANFLYTFFGCVSSPEVRGGDSEQSSWVILIPKNSCSWDKRDENWNLGQIITINYHFLQLEEFHRTWVHIHIPLI